MPLDLLVCPACRGDLDLDAAGGAVRCAACGRAYPVVDGVPWLIPEAARRR